MLRAIPSIITRVPYVTGACGLPSERTPTRNQVESSPSARRKSQPFIVDSPCAPTPVIVSTRPEGPSSSVTSESAPRTPSIRRRRWAETTNGPQRWCGEIVSYGSLTETRYGVAGELGNTSGADAVRPPELEKKYVVATFPP